MYFLNEGNKIINRYNKFAYNQAVYTIQKLKDNCGVVYLNHKAVLQYYKKTLKNCHTKVEYNKLIDKIEKNIRGIKRNSVNLVNKDQVNKMIKDHEKWLTKVKEAMKENT